jgi:hypothetical protein
MLAKVIGATRAQAADDAAQASARQTLVGANAAG